MFFRHFLQDINAFSSFFAKNEGKYKKHLHSPRFTCYDYYEEKGENLWQKVKLKNTGQWNLRLIPL